MRGYGSRILGEVRRAMEEEHTPGEIGLSFSVGLFVCSLPTGGLGLLFLFLLDRRFVWVSQVSLLCAVLVINPLVKGSIYVTSYWIGGRILGDTAGGSGVTYAILSIAVGSVAVAVVFAAVGYPVAVGLTRAYRARETEVVKAIREDVVEAIEGLETDEGEGAPGAI